jgi:hypothetical protein
MMRERDKRDKEEEEEEHNMLIISNIFLLEAH